MDSIKKSIQDKYHKFKNTLLMKKSITKLDIVSLKYNELKETMKGKPYYNKFASIIEIEENNVSKVLVFVILKFKNKDINQVICGLAKDNNIELSLDEINDISTHIYEFIYCINDLGLV